MKIPAAHSTVNITNAMCIVDIRFAESMSYREVLPTVPLTTIVMIAMPVDCPVVLMVERIEFATLNFAGGTQPMITFVLGDEKNAIPIPATARAITTSHIGVPSFINAKNSKESAHSPIPADASL